MKMRVMIAEDEPMAQKELIYLLEKEVDVQLFPSAETGRELVELYKQYEPDIVFLDVEMPELSGVEAAKRIVEITYMQTPYFVFTTAYDEYAIEAFEIDAVDYLLKPYDEIRFQTALKRIRARLNKFERTMIQQIQQQQQQVVSARLLVDDGEKMAVLSPESIYYAEPVNRMLEIHTAEKVVKSRLRLQELEKELTGYAFFRTHRSYLVNLNHILEITPWFNGTSNVTLNDKARTVIPVSRAARKILFEHFNL